MMVAACLTMAAIHILVWFRNRDMRANLCFSILAVSLAAFMAYEFLLMRTTSVEIYTALHQQAHVAMFLLVVSILGFVHCYFRTGRTWLMWTVIGLRVLVLVLAFFPGPTFNFREIHSLGSFELFGETASTPIGTPSPWARLGEISGLLVLVFVLDASIRLWRQGDSRARRRALVVGGAVVFAILLPLTFSLLLHTGRIHTPYIASGAFLLIVGAMGYELGYDLIQSGRMARELEKLRRELAHAGRLTLLGQLASSLAHELSQPLGAILRNAEAAELMLAADSPDLTELRAIIQDIHADDQRASTVIERLHSLLQRGNLDLQPLALTDVVSEACALLHTDASSRNVQLHTSLSDDLPLVMGDRVHLIQVLLNLIVNAMDAIEQSGDRGHGQSITLALNATRGDTVEVLVSDTGPGISSDVRNHLFEPFFTTKPDGMGMGLPICRTIIEAHGGTLTLDTRDGAGAGFLILLPANIPTNA